MGFLARLLSDERKRYPSANGTGKGSRMPAPYGGPQPPGRFSFGTQTQGGPQYSDAFKSRPSPSLTQLVENYGAIIYAMVSRNRDAVSRLPMRLMADGSRVQGGKPGRASDPIKVSRRIGERLARAGKISSAAVDQVYEIRNHPLLETVERPDPYGNFTKEQFIGLICSYMDVVGSAYLVPEGNGWDWRNPNEPIKGPPQFLWVIYPQYTIPIRLSSSPIIDHFMYFADWLPRSSTIWFRHNCSLRDAYGSSFSPTNAGEPYRKQEQEQVAILSQVLGIGPRPNMIASAKDPLMAPGKKEKEAFEQDLINKHAAGYAGGILVTTGAFDFTPTSFTPADLGGNEIAQQDIYNLASIFGQPPTYYTIDSNLANLQAADEHHAKFGVEPRCKTIAAVFTDLARSFDQRLFFQFDSAITEDEEAKQRIIDMQLKNGQICINQANEEYRWPKVPYGDEPWFPGTLKQPSMIQAEHQMAQTAQAESIKNEKKATDFQYSQEDADVEEESGGYEERSLLRRLDAIADGIESELRFFANAGNPHHDAEGHFTHAGGEGHAAQHGKAAQAPGKHHAKNQRKKKRKKVANKDKPGGGGGEKKQLTDRERKGKPAVLSDKAAKAQLHQNKTTRVQQEYAKKNEFEFAAKVGGKAFPDNGPIDIEMSLGGKTHGIELKTLTHGKNDKVTMKGEALERKANWEKGGGVLHTVVLDHRDKMAGSESLHSGHEIYYKRGAGSFRISSMTKVKDIAELKSLMVKK